jgi:hypothetical protein
MANTVRGTWYNDIQLDCNYPEIANVAAADYVAKTFKGNQLDNVQRPFILAHPEAVTLKVEPWLGEVVTWNFTAGPYPMPLRRILNDPANTATQIQICY